MNDNRAQNGTPNLSIAQLRRPFKQQRTAVTKSSIMRVRRDLEQADREMHIENNKEFLMRKNAANKKNFTATITMAATL